MTDVNLSELIAASLRSQLDQHCQVLEYQAQTWIEEAGNIRSVKDMVYAVDAATVLAVSARNVGEALVAAELFRVSVAIPEHLAELATIGIGLWKEYLETDTVTVEFGGLVAAAKEFENRGRVECQ